MTKDERHPTPPVTDPNGVEITGFRTDGAQSPPAGGAEQMPSLDTSPAEVVLPTEFGHDPHSLAEFWAKTAAARPITRCARVWLQGDDPQNGHLAYCVLGRWQDDLWLYNFVFGMKAEAHLSKVVAYTPAANPPPAGWTETDLLEFLSRKYVLRADPRQAAMGLAYLDAEVHDLAREVASFVATTPNPTVTDKSGGGAGG